MTDKYLIKKKSNIHGYGIFTQKVIKKSEVFYKIPLTKTYSKNHRRYAYIGKGRYVSDPKVLNWVNHSDKPNFILDITKRIPVMVAKRKISVGEEITCDYNKTEIDRITFKFD